MAALALAAALSATPCLADWRKELGTFRIGIVEAQARQHSPAELDKIRAAYATTLGMPVEIIQSKDFPSLIDAHASSRIEYAVYTAEAYAASALACECVEPLAAPVAEDGSAGVRAVLIADAGLSISAIASSKGIGVPGLDDMAVYGVALASFQSGGQRLTGTDSWIRAENGVRGVISGFANGRLDGFFSAVPSRLSMAGVLAPGTPVADEVLKSGRKAKAVWLSEIIPFGPHAVRKNLAPEAKALLAGMLSGLAAADPEMSDLLLPEGMVAFALVQHSAYGLALDATKALAEVALSPKP